MQPQGAQDSHVLLSKYHRHVFLNSFNCIKNKIAFQIWFIHKCFHILNLKCCNHCFVCSCEDAAGQEIDTIDKISTKGFYIETGTVQVSYGVPHYYYNHRQPSLSYWWV